jgi:hypothetical protein
MSLNEDTGENEMVEFTAHFDGHVITPDERVEIPKNVPLRVTIERADQPQVHEVDWKRLLDLARDCQIDGPADLAERHDHYAHGKPIE